MLASRKVTLDYMTGKLGNRRARWVSMMATLVNKRVRLDCKMAKWDYKMEM